MGNEDLSNQQKIFRDQIGQKASVERWDLPKEKTELLNRQLCDLGLKWADADDVVKNMTYYGSAAIHVYASDILKLQLFIPQAAPLVLYKCPMPMANAAMQELDRKMRQVYGMSKGKLRSGF